MPLMQWPAVAWPPALVGSAAQWYPRGPFVSGTLLLTMVDAIADELDDPRLCRGTRPARPEGLGTIGPAALLEIRADFRGVGSVCAGGGREARRRCDGTDHDQQCDLSVHPVPPFHESGHGEWAAARIRSNGISARSATSRTVCAVSFELAEHDLVLTQKQRTAVQHRLIRAQLGDHALDPSVERGEVGLVDTGPEALGNEALSLGFDHAVEARPAATSRKGGNTLRNGSSRLPFDRPRKLSPRPDAELAVGTRQVRLHGLL